MGGGGCRSCFQHLRGNIHLETTSNMEFWVKRPEMHHHIISSGKSKGGLSKGGLGPKGANWAKKGPFGAISALPPWLWGAEELVPIGPEKAPIGPEKVPICPEKARFRRKDFPPIFSENLGLKPPFVSPPLDFPNIKPSSACLGS